jgi:AcrR family transcriptional regulator
MVLERVASDAGYTKGALYHQFASKEELVLAMVEWVCESWVDEVGVLLDEQTDPVATLIAVARAHAAYSRHDPVLTRLRTELAGSDHPVEKAINEAMADCVASMVRLIEAGRTAGAIPPGPPSRLVAVAYIGAIDGVLTSLNDDAPYDAVLAERASMGVLGLAPRSKTT